MPSHGPGGACHDGAEGANAHAELRARGLRPGEAEPDSDDDEHERDACRRRNAVERERLERGGRDVRHEEEERPRAMVGGIQDENRLNEHGDFGQVGRVADVRVQRGALDEDDQRFLATHDG